MLILLKLKEFLKTNWVPILLICGVLAFSFFKIHNMEKVLDAAVQSNTEQINILNKSHEEEIKQKEQLAKEYQEKLTDIEDKYTQQTKELQLERNKKIKTIIKYYNQDPQKLADKVVEVYGFKYVK